MTLAAVMFPLAASAAEAKSFLAGELDEIRLSPCGPVVWDETPTFVTARWPASADPVHDPVSADLLPGVAEQVLDVGTDVLTAAVRFDRSAGWDRSAAEEWVERPHLGGENGPDGAGRTAGRHTDTPTCPGRVTN